LNNPVLTVLITFDDKKKEEVAFARAGAMVVAARGDEPGTAVVATASFDDALKAMEGIK
jgi:hypothetical protein